MQDITKLQQEAEKAVSDVKDLAELEQIRLEYLGKKGKLTEILKNLNTISSDLRPQVGQTINLVKRSISLLLDEKFQTLKTKALEKKLEEERIDVTLPGRQIKKGSIHPVTQVKLWINEYFSKLGFDIVIGPEIESDFYNFEALNIPKHHPARAMHDTFYFGDGRLLRTHTSSVQIRQMENKKPPLRLIAPGRVYRCESDQTHTPMFHQVEGLFIDKDVTFTHLRAIFQNFFTQFFSKNLALRFRPAYFPFTEPSAEVDIECTQCSGKGCRSCKFTGWLEVLGCGMVHPEVLKSVNISPEDYQGWAFGMGIDRLAMLLFGIDDLRLMFENDLNFLKQF